MRLRLSPLLQSKNHRNHLDLMTLLVFVLDGLQSVAILQHSKRYVIAPTDTFLVIGDPDIMPLIRASVHIYPAGRRTTLVPPDRMTPLRLHFFVIRLARSSLHRFGYNFIIEHLNNNNNNLNQTIWRYTNLNPKSNTVHGFSYSFKYNLLDFFRF